MSSATQEAFTPLWRVLGLSVAGGYAGLGSLGFFSPITTASTYGLRSPNSNPQNDEYVSVALKWIGARDISIAAALFAFYFEGKPREMGTLILAGTFLTATDSYYVYKARRDLFGASIGVGAAIWFWIGWNLVGM